MKAFAFVVVAEILYLLAGNLLLNGDFLPQMLSREPDRFSIEWTSGGTIVPGHLRVTGLKLSGQTGPQQWWLSIGQGEARLALGSLFFKTLRLQGVEVDNVTAGVRDRIALASAPSAGPAATAGDLPMATALPQADAAPETPARPEGELAQADAAPATPTRPAKGPAGPSRSAMRTSHKSGRSKSLATASAGRRGCAWMI